jgi:hypothetical protein
VSGFLVASKKLGADMTSWKRKSLNELKILRKSKKPSEKQSARQGKKKLM